MQTRPDTVTNRAVIYVRVSSTRQEDEGTSLETQLDRCRTHAQVRGWQVVAEFRDTHTATELHERPQLTSLREMIRSGAADIVVCYAVDRLSRNQAHVYILAEEFERAGIDLSFVTEDFEQSAVGKFIRSAKAFAAEVEHEKIRERTVRGRIRRVESGKLIPGGKPLYGYHWIDRDGKTKAALVIDDVAAGVVRRIFADVASGKSLRQIARDLVTEGIPTPTGRGNGWYTSTIAQILHKPAYKGDAYGWGWRKGGTTPQTFDPTKAIPLPEGTVPPIVDAEMWNAVQSILTRNKDRAIRSAKNPEAALLRGGFVRCGYCGQAMYARPRNNGAVEYVCRPRTNASNPCVAHSMMAHRLDPVVWEKASAILTNPAVVAREVTRLRRDDPTIADLTAVERALGEVERQQASLARAIAMLEEDDAAAPLVARLAALANQRRQLRAERQSIHDRRQSWVAAEANLDSVERWCQRVAANLSDLTYQQKRMALDALGFEVRLFRADHRPRYVIAAMLRPEVASSTT